MDGAVPYRVVIALTPVLTLSVFREKSHFFRFITRWCGKGVIRYFSQEGAAHMNMGRETPPLSQLWRPALCDILDSSLSQKKKFYSKLLNNK